MTRTEFLREATLSGKNKCKRTPLPSVSFADMDLSISERKAYALKWIFENMPLYIGEKELIVGTRTYFEPNSGNEDGHDVFEYTLETKIPYLKKEEIEFFGCDQSYLNKTHYTPDFSIILKKGIAGLINDAENKLNENNLTCLNIEFLKSIIIALKGLSNLIERYSLEAMKLAEREEGVRKDELLNIARICKKISKEPADTFHEALQLLWFSHLGTIIESFQFINYGRLDVILGEYLKNTPECEAQELIECFLLKTYDQVDLNTTYLGKYAAQLVVTLGGVLPNGENAVNKVSLMFLDAIDKVRLPEPEFNLRISTKNPPEFLDKAAKLTVSGCNFVSYYNDDEFVKSLNKAGVPIEYARDYGFDLCQDINIPGKGDFYNMGDVPLALILMPFLKDKNFTSFDELISAFKELISEEIKKRMDNLYEIESNLELYRTGNLKEFHEKVVKENKSFSPGARSPMCPLPFISSLYHGCIENATDLIYKPLPVKEEGFFTSLATEAINSLAAIKKVVYDKKQYTLKDVYEACESDFEGEKGATIRNALWDAPKWGNDDDYVDLIAKDILEYSLKDAAKYKTFRGGNVLTGVHQPHPVPSGAGLMATAEGRHSGAPVAVTLTPESGTMKNGPTAALLSAAKIDSSLIQWNYCVMINYYASAFKGEEGSDVFKTLLKVYFEKGGMQHQPNVLDADDLRKAQLEPDKYKDLIVRLWGVSAHFVDLPKNLQDEMIVRFS